MDIFVKKELKIKHYLRYGDDFLIFGASKEEVGKNGILVDRFIEDNLKMSINYKNRYSGRVKEGIKFCGVNIFVKGRKLNKRMRRRVFKELNFANAASYKALLFWHDKKLLQKTDWRLLLHFEKMKITYTDHLHR